jgi:membrane protein implicated in regulation of membrane protease activity
MVLPLYLTAAIIGGGMVLVSALGGMFGHGADHDATGGHDHDFHVGGHDHDAGAGDHDHDHEVGHQAADAAGKVNDVFNAIADWIPFLSLRFWMAFAATFGVLGSILTIMKMSVEPMTLITSLAAGLFTGVLVHTIITALKRTMKDSSVAEKDMVGTAGRVLVSPRGLDPGKIRIELKGDIIDMLAVSDDGKDIEAGTEIFVVAIEGQRARIARQEDLLN